MKKMSLNRIGNTINLLIERDSGNEILILFGKPEIAINDWIALANLCDEAIETIEDECRNKKLK